MNVYLMIGLPGSGKSSWAAKKALEPNTYIVNRDSLYKMLGGRYDCYSKELSSIVAAGINSMVTALLMRECNVILDETHTTRSRRLRSLEVLREYRDLTQVRVVYVHCTETERNLDYRLKEDRGLSASRWGDVIRGMKEGFEDYTDEDYDELIMVDDI